MEIRNIEINKRLDRKSSQQVQDLDMSFTFGSEDAEFTADVTGQVFVENKKVKPYVMVHGNFIYRSGGSNVPLYIAGIEEDELRDVLIKHCT